MQFRIWDNGGMAILAVEYAKSVFHRRRWTVLTAPPFFITFLNWLVSYRIPLPVDVRSASIWSAPWWEWLIAYLCCFAVAQILAWREEYRKVLDLTQALKEERENLTDCPRIILEFERGGFFSWFCVSNRGSVDARRIKIKALTKNTYTLTSDEISYIKSAQSNVPLILRAGLNNADGLRGPVDGMEAFKAIAEEVEHEVHPIDSNGPQIDQLNEWVNFAEVHHILVHICVVYSDLAGKEFESDSEVVWSPLVREIVEIRPGLYAESLQ